MSNSSTFSVFVTTGNCIIIFLIPLTILGDLAVCTAFCLNRTLRTRTNVFFLSLVTSDILLALLVMPLEIVRLSHYLHWPFGRTVCNVFNSGFVSLGGASICNLCATGIDRYLAISRPLRYCREISNTVIASVAFVWLFAFISGFISYFLWSQSHPLICADLSAPLSYSVLLLLFDLLAPFVICLFMYAKIFRISRQQARKITSTCRWIRGKHYNALQEKKSAKTLSILVGLFALAYLPFLIFHAIDGAFNEQFPNRFYFGSVVKWLVFANSTLNWAVYGFLNKEYRKALFKICSALWCKRRHRIIDQADNIDAYSIS
ncbi:octopamine receptor 1-like [Stylophora pistillata]|uniref:octopamine receptor 1-like n=1 Tax=Stylophora pistillata TaxID=50429 RepID=UPI000C03D500|nr:octopamine receptor 1-like [Stylophora pistillata]